MSTKPLWFAILAVVGAFAVVSQSTGASPLPLSHADLQVAVGACEAHGSVTQVSCEIASDSCDGDTGPECESDTWRDGCVGVNTPKPDGSGSENHQEANCSNTYDSGPCEWTSIGRCIQGEATSSDLTCGDRVGSDDC